MTKINKQQKECINSPLSAERRYCQKHGKEKQAHTRAPWTLSEHGNAIYEGSKQLCYVPDKKDAEKIFRIYETHRELLAVLKELHQDEIENKHYGDNKRDCTYCKLISRAEAK